MMNPLTTKERSIITSGQWLAGEHMDRFADLLCKYSNYNMQATWKVQYPQYIEPILDPTTAHIQILHSCENIGTNADGHWICSYYDGQRISIYDSLNKKKLHNHHKIYLEKLFPFYSFDKLPIRFVTVQRQPNGNDCGVFSIAFAISLLLNVAPETVTYDVTLMRQHLLKLFEDNYIEHFPIITRVGDDYSLSRLKVAGRFSEMKPQQKDRRERSKLRLDDQRPCEIEKTSKKKMAVVEILTDRHVVNVHEKSNKPIKIDYSPPDAVTIAHFVKQPNKVGEKSQVLSIGTADIVTDPDCNDEIQNSIEKIIPCVDDTNGIKKGEYEFYSSPLEDEVVASKITKARYVSDLDESPETTDTKPSMLNVVSSNQRSRFSNKPQETEQMMNCSTTSAEDTKSSSISEQLRPRNSNNLRKKRMLERETEEQRNRRLDKDRQRKAEQRRLKRTGTMSAINDGLQKVEKSLKAIGIDSRSWDEQMECSTDENVGKTLFEPKILPARSANPAMDSDLKDQIDFNDKIVIDHSNTENIKNGRYDYDTKTTVPQCVMAENLLAASIITSQHAAKTWHFSSNIQDSTLSNKLITSGERTNSIMTVGSKKIPATSDQLRLRTVNRLRKTRQLQRETEEHRKQRLDKGKQREVTIKHLKRRAEIDITNSSSLSGSTIEIYPIKKRGKFSRSSLDEQKSLKALRNAKYYNTHRQFIMARRIKRYNHAKLKICQAKKITKKYFRINAKLNSIEMSVSKQNCITNIEKFLKNRSAAENRLEAERIVKWCFYGRDEYIRGMKNALKFMKDKAEVSLTKLATCTNGDTNDIVTALCGDEKLHTGSSEAYFTETAYNQCIHFVEPIVLNKHGQAVNILPLNSNKKRVKEWGCSKTICKIIEREVADSYSKFLTLIRSCSIRNVMKNFEKIHKCSNPCYGNHLGHSLACYITPTHCKSLFISLEFLSPHFVQVRNMKRSFYRVWSFHQKVLTVDEALKSSNVDVLRQIADSVQQNSRVFKSNKDVDLNEDVIISEHPAAFNALVKRSMDVPRFACFSCEKLCFRRDITAIENLKKPVSGSFWRDLLKHVQEQGDDCEHICHYCLGKLRVDKLPATCILNKLVVKAVPDVLSQLNDYEKMLIQRAKAFQTVQSMGTVAKKNLPHRAMVKKVKGRTFHLPLPMDETLKKICPPTDAINKEHELYILVRGIPTKSKVVWEQLVDVQKVFAALSWFKDHNPLYSEIKLPTFPHELFEADIQDVEFKIDGEVSVNSDCESDDNVEDITKGNVNRTTNIESDRKALLTQMSSSDSYYEQFTVHPMYSDKENKSSTELYQMLKVQSLALEQRYASLDLECFPDLFPYGVNGLHEDRCVRLTPFEFIKSRLKSKHPQFRLNQQYIFFLLNDANIRQLSSGIFHKMNVTNTHVKYTAASYLNQLAKGELEGNLNTVFERLRNTTQYWRKPRSSLNCMIQNYGPATWFLTLSPSEWLWTDLIQYLRDINGSVASKMGTNELIAADPISVSRFIDNKFHAMLDFLCSEDKPIGEVINYFWRREYQGRGTQHFHLLIWIKDAPILGISSNDDVVSFISKYCTCRIPSKNVSPVLYGRVNTHQRHSHNSYCMRARKIKNRTVQSCRFGFPRPDTNSFVLRNVATSIAGRRQLKSKSRLYDLPRSREEGNINDYNPVILTAWEGNMDIQFVGEKSTVLNFYCTKYISKAEKSYAADLFEQVNSTKSLASRLWNIALRTLNNRECGALEAADTLLGISLYGTDPATSIRWVDVNIVRSRKLKPRKEIEAMNDESTDIFYRSLVDYYYPRRPNELRKLNLYEFSKWYDIVKVRPKDIDVEFYLLQDGLYLKRRSRGYLINHYKYDVRTKPENYFFALLIQFQPWIDVDELKNGCETYAESFLLVQNNLPQAVEYHERINEVKEGLEDIQKLVEQQMSENDVRQEKDDCNMEDIGCIPMEADDAIKDFKDIGDKQKPVNVQAMINDLNSDQKRVFDTVTRFMQTENEILRLYVSGEGGTGKSFLIETIKCWIKEVVGKDTAVAAPTGIAAFNVNGLTVHRLFQLVVEHGQTPKYRELSDAVLKILRDQLKNVALIIIDEVSMISNVVLMFIHLRLTEIFNSSNVENGWFGKKHIVLFGDLLQLPPVREEPVFMKLSTTKIEQLLGSLGSANLWSFFTYDELNINMRQKNDASYRELLSRIRIGFVTMKDEEVLQSRKIKFNSISMTDRVQQLCTFISSLPSDTVCLLPTCRMCNVLNEAMLSRITSDEILLVARDSIDCPRYMKSKVSKTINDDEDSSRTAGLSRVITVKIGAKVMIRRNIDVTLGLVNGAIATVVSVIRAIDKNDVEKVKVVLSNERTYEIGRDKVKFQVMDRAFVFREQFPFILSYGITIHKSQGLSLKHAVVDAGNSVFSCGQVYVAMSRVTSLEGLHLINYDPHSIKANELAVIEYNRLRAQFRPDLGSMTVQKRQLPKVADQVWAVPEIMMECQIENERVLSKKASYIHAFQNADEISDYANATVQCIFHCKILRDKLLGGSGEDQDLLTALLREYIDKKPELSTNSIRHMAGGVFVEEVKQDALEFFKTLCRLSYPIQNSVEYQLTTTILCKTCNYTMTSAPQMHYVLTLSMPTNNKTYTLQEIVNLTQSQWNRIEGSCGICQTENNRVSRISISMSNEIVILQVAIISHQQDIDQSTKTSCNIKAVPTSLVMIGGRKYKIFAAVFHHGHNINGGYYTSMLRSDGNSWLQVTDDRIEKKSWPRNAKDGYLFFLEKK